MAFRHGGFQWSKLKYLRLMSIRLGSIGFCMENLLRKEMSPFLNRRWRMSRGIALWRIWVLGWDAWIPAGRQGIKEFGLFDEKKWSFVHVSTVDRQDFVWWNVSRTWLLERLSFGIYIHIYKDSWSFVSGKLPVTRRKVVHKWKINASKKPCKSLRRRMNPKYARVFSLLGWSQKCLIPKRF